MRTVLAALCLSLSASAFAAVTPRPGLIDARVRVVAYNPDDVIVLTGYRGYPLHLQFAEDERFVGLYGGRMPEIGVDDERNNVWIKAIQPDTKDGRDMSNWRANFTTYATLLTNRRTYHIEYTSIDPTPTKGSAALGRPPIFSVRFTYPIEEAAAARAAAERAAQAEKEATEAKAAQPQENPRNTDYWFCGADALRPEYAWDDGAQIHLGIRKGGEFPAMFAQDDDGKEYIVNYHVDERSADVVIHRTARRLVLRLGNTVGCVVNKGFDAAHASKATVQTEHGAASHPQRGEAQ